MCVCVHDCMHVCALRKTEGKSVVLPKFILHSGIDLWDRMLEVMQKV